MHYFEHEFGEIHKRKSTVKGDRITKLDDRGKNNKKKINCSKTFESVSQRGFECDFRFLTTLPWVKLPLRNLGLDSIFLLKTPEGEALIEKEETKVERIQK